MLLKIHSELFYESSLRRYKGYFERRITSCCTRKSYSLRSQLSGEQGVITQSYPRITDKIDMNLVLVKDDQLTPELFERHPVWAEYHEPADVERMVTDGYKADEVKRELERTQYSDSYLIPIQNYEVPSPYEFTYYKAKALVCNQHEFSAYLFAINGLVNSLGLFDGKYWQVVNMELMDAEEKSELENALGLISLFPLRIWSCGGIAFDETYEQTP